MEMATTGFLRLPSSNMMSETSYRVPVAASIESNKSDQHIFLMT